MKPYPLVLACALLSSCATPDGDYPSLAPRTAETIDPRVPVPDLSAQDVGTTPVLAARLDALVDQARAGQSRFEAAIASAERFANRAGAPRTEGWIAAQQALSVAIAERLPVTRALADTDELIRTSAQSASGLRRPDLENAQRAANEIATIDRSQAARVDAVQRRLGL